MGCMGRQTQAVEGASSKVEKGDRVRLCHKVLRVVRVGSEQVTLRGELAGIHGQEVLAPKEYARNNRVEGAER